MLTNKYKLCDFFSHDKTWNIVEFVLEYFSLTSQKNVYTIIVFPPEGGNNDLVQKTQNIIMYKEVDSI